MMRTIIVACLVIGAMVFIKIVVAPGIVHNFGLIGVAVTLGCMYAIAVWMEKGRAAAEKTIDLNETDDTKKVGGGVASGWSARSDWWNVLEISPDAPFEKVRAAYLEKIKLCHPDRVVGLALHLVAEDRDGGVAAAHAWRTGCRC
jgi:hypothetical protein